MWNSYGSWDYIWQVGYEDNCVINDRFCECCLVGRIWKGKSKIHRLFLWFEHFVHFWHQKTNNCSEQDGKPIFWAVFWNKVVSNNVFNEYYRIFCTKSEFCTSFCVGKLKINEKINVDPLPIKLFWTKFA